jgi:anti-sigma-K factor RskA
MVVAIVVTAAAAVASCCGSVATATPRGGSPIVAALFVARNALDEHRLVGTDAPDLNILAGARLGTVSTTLQTRRQEIEL